MLRIYITRHGQTQWNQERRLQGWKDAPLTELGIKQAEELGNRIKKIDLDHIYCSPLGRTKKTAEIALDGKNIPLSLDERLKEINMGDWEGIDAEKVKENHPKHYNLFWNSPDKYEPDTGESYIDIYDRVTDALDEIISKHSDENILIISHGCASKVMLAYFEGRPLGELWESDSLKETSLSLVEIDGEEVNIRMYGDTSHLDNLPSEKD